MPGYSLGLDNLAGQVESTILELHGALPDWLDGTLVRNGPALFDVGDQTFNHWFDGLSALHKFDFSGGKVAYSCKFLGSDAYKKAISNKRISSMEFGTRRAMTFLDRVTNVFSPELTDNGNVNVLHLEDRFMAATETPCLTEFALADLKTIGPVRFDDHIKFHVTTAHPHYDFNRKTLYNIAVTFGPKSHYALFEQKAGAQTRRPLGSVKSATPGYMHGFAMSEKYAVLCEFPLRLSLPQLLFGARPYRECYHWWSQAATNLIVVSKENGEVVRQFEVEAAFAFHQINAFESGDQLFVDMVVYNDAAIVDALALPNLRAGGKVPVGKPRRFCLDLRGGEVSSQDLADCAFEFPQINYREHAGLRYKYCYGAGSERSGDNFLDDLRKIDVEDGTVLTWRQAGCYPGEPVFVSRTTGGGEDDGVLLSLVLDAEKRQSFLLVLDGVTMQQLAKLTLPQIAPLTFHGIFARRKND